MDKIHGSIEGPIDSKQTAYHGGDFDPVPVTCKDYLVLTHEKINYYFINLETVNWSRIWNIVKACADVESACWKAQENFPEYLKKRSVLCYAEKDGRVIGFAAASLFVSGTACLHCNDETMVLREFRNKRLALNLVVIPLEYFFSRTAHFKHVTHGIFTSISANPKVVNFYFKNSYAQKLFDCSFKPSMELIMIKNDYCRAHGIDLVHEDYPFCLKNLFPGSNSFDRNDPRFQFSEQVKANLPPDFDHMDRGDAFAFMLKIPRRAARIVVAVLMARCFGRDYYFNTKGIGLLSSKRQPLSPRVEEGKEIPVRETARMSVVSPQHDAPQKSSASKSSSKKR